MYILFFFERQKILRTIFCSLNNHHYDDDFPVQIAHKIAPAVTTMKNELSHTYTQRKRKAETNHVVSSFSQNEM